MLPATPGQQKITAFAMPHNVLTGGPASVPRVASLFLILKPAQLVILLAFSAWVPCLRIVLPAVLLSNSKVASVYSSTLQIHKSKIRPVTNLAVHAMAQSRKTALRATKTLCSLVPLLRLVTVHPIWSRQTMIEAAAVVPSYAALAISTTSA